MPAMEFLLEGPNGTGVIDEGHIMQQLQQGGYPTLGISADGLTVTFQDPTGGQPYEVDTRDVLKEMGWQVAGMNPIAPDYGAVQPEWRAAISALPDDDMKQAYLEAKLKRVGIDTPMITGRGRDWFVYNPNTSQWLAVTNSPDLELADLGEVASEGAHILGSAIGGGFGGTAGAFAGPVGSIAGASAGGAAGGGLADLARNKILSEYDPEFAGIREKYQPRMAEEARRSMAFDALTMGGLKGLGMAMPGVRSLLAKGPLSTAARTAGRGFESAGAGLAQTAKTVAETPFLRELGMFSTPGVAETATLGFLGQLPTAALRGSVKGLGKVAESPSVQRILGAEQSGALGRLSQELLAKRAPARGLAEEMASRMGAGAAEGSEASARDIVGNIAEKLGQSFGKGPGFQEKKDAMEASYRLAREYGLSPFEAREIGGEAIKEMEKYWAKSAGQRAGQIGEKIGTMLGGAESAGRGLERTASGAFSLLTSGARGLGVGAKLGGAGLRTAGTLGQPLEVPALTRLGAEELYRSWPRRRDQDIMNQTYLVGN